MPPARSRIAQVKTLAGVIRTTGLAIIASIAGMQFLDAVGINFGPLLASAGIAGIAIGLAAQNIVKDMLNGILILIEDQFNVGDTVRLAGLAGTVEAMTLRKTTVRDADGTLYVIPNSQITTVANLSVGYSVATVNVSVDFSANPDEVLKLLTSIATEVRNSDEFRQLFVADPQILGVDAIKGSELIFPVVFKTLATKQYGPIREFRRRVRLALEEHHLLPGNPYRIFNEFCGPIGGRLRPASGSRHPPGPHHNQARRIQPLHRQQLNLSSFFSLHQSARQFVRITRLAVVFCGSWKLCTSSDFLYRQNSLNRKVRRALCTPPTRFRA